MFDEKTLRSTLLEGDRRSIGRANEVADHVRVHPKVTDSLVKCMWDSDACVRMRAADALEKISRDHATLLQPYKKHLLVLLTETDQKEVRWHLAVTIPRLKLTAAECRQTAVILQTFLQDRSSILKTFAMQGLSDLASHDSALRSTVVELIRSLARSGTPAMRARGRILLRQLETDSD